MKNNNINYDEFDKIEELYKNSVLGKGKNSIPESKKRYKPNDTGIFIIAFIVALIILGLIILVVGKKDKKNNRQKNKSNEVAISYESGDTFNNNVDELDKEEVVITEDTGDKQSLKDNAKQAENTTKEKPKEKTTSKPVSNITQTVYVVQLIASNNSDELKKEVNKLKKRGINVRIIEDSKTPKYKLILSSEFKKREDANTYMNQLKKKKLIPNDAWIRTIEKK